MTRVDDPAPSLPPTEPEGDKKTFDSEVGTHPMAMISLVAGIMSLACGVMCCLDPRLAGVMHTTLGLLSLSTAGATFYKVSKGEFDETNLFQARIALGLGALGLIIGLAWIAWWMSDPFNEAGAR